MTDDPHAIERSQRQTDIDALKHVLRPIWSPHALPAELPAAADVYATRTPGLFIGSVVIVQSPHFAKPMPCLITTIHDPKTDIAMTVTSIPVTFNGQRPRVDALCVTPHEIEPYTILKLVNVPHRLDAEHACMLADGNTVNLGNITYYVTVQKMTAS